MWRRKSIAAAVKWSVSACHHPLGDEKLRLFLAELLCKGMPANLMQQVISTMRPRATLLQHVPSALWRPNPLLKCC